MEVKINFPENPEKIPYCDIRVRFQDCDPFGHLNNGKYFDYFLNAREEHLRRFYNMDLFVLAFQYKLSWVVSQHQILYLRAADLSEQLVIESQIFEFDTRRLLVEQRMYNEDKTELKSLLWTEYVHFDMKTKKSIKHSEQWMDLFGQVHLPLEQKTFRERKRFLLQRR